MTDVVFGEVRQRAPAEAETDALAGHVLLPDRAHNLLQVDVAALGACVCAEEASVMGGRARRRRNRKKVEREGEGE